MIITIKLMNAGVFQPGNILYMCWPIIERLDLRVVRTFLIEGKKTIWEVPLSYYISTIKELLTCHLPARRYNSYCCKLMVQRSAYLISHLTDYRHGRAHRSTSSYRLLFSALPFAFDIKRNHVQEAWQGQASLLAAAYVGYFHHFYTREGRVHWR